MKRAINMAKLLSLPLDVLHVIQLRKAGYFAFIDRHLQEEQEAYAQKVLDEAVRMAQKSQVEARPHLLEGEKDPSGSIIAFLDAARGVKFLVLGSHGHGFIGRHLIGSTTERVLR
jgi:nucleotide-binding universal stress UspA family protein